MTASILVGLYLGLTGKLQLPKFRVLLVVAVVFVTMKHGRNSQLFGILMPLLIAGLLPRGGALPSALKRRLADWAPLGLVVSAAMISLLARVALPVERVDELNYASAALASVPEELRAKPVLNDYGLGGQLIFNGVRPFIDGRADLYGDEFMGMYLSVVRAKGDMLDEVLCRYNIEWTIFGADTAVPALMDRTPGWRRLYSDKVAVVHVREQSAGRRTCAGLQESQEQTAGK